MRRLLLKKFSLFLLNCSECYEIDIYCYCFSLFLISTLSNKDGKNNLHWNSSYDQFILTNAMKVMSIFHNAFCSIHSLVFYSYNKGLNLGQK